MPAEYVCDECKETFVDEPGLREVGHDEKEDGTPCFGTGLEVGVWEPEEVFASHADEIAAAYYDVHEDRIREEQAIADAIDWSF